MDSQSLGVREGVLFGKDLEVSAASSSGIVRPSDGDFVDDTINDVELANTEGWRENGALEGCTTRGSFISVERGRGIQAKYSLDGVLEAWHSTGATDDFNRVEIFFVETGSGETLDKGGLDSLEKRGGELVELVPVDFAVDVFVVHQTFEVQRNVDCVGRHGLLGFFASFDEFDKGSDVLGSIDFVFFDERIIHVLPDDLVEVASSESLVVGRSEDGELALVHGGCSDLERVEAKINEDDVSAWIGGFGKILLVNTVGEGGGGGFGHDLERTETGDGGGILKCSALLFAVKDWASDDTIFRASAKVGVGDFFHFPKEHGGHLRDRVGSLAWDIHGGETGGFVLDNLVGGGEFASDELLHFGVLEWEANESFEIENGGFDL